MIDPESETHLPGESGAHAGWPGAEAVPAQSEAEPETEVMAGEAQASAAALEERITALQSLADEYLDGWQRSRAEFANYKNRLKRDEQEMYAQTAASLLARTLPVVDDLERALRDRPADNDASPWADGIERIYRKLRDILESEGVETIPAEGLAFEPTVHEALSHEASPDHKEGQVIEVVVPGYRLGERVLRPALVRVAK